MLIEGNESLEERPAQVNRDPYGAWMARCRPTDWAADRARLVDAAASASFDCEVEIHFAGPAVRLLVAGVAANLRPWPDMTTSIYDMMRQAANLDARFIACAMAMKALVAPDEKLIPEYSGTAGASAFVQRALDPEWATLIY